MKIGRNMIINVECIGLYVQYLLFLLGFNKTWIFWTDLRKILKC